MTDDEIAVQRGGYSSAALHRRGWTDRMIDIALGWPDSFAVNPHYSSGAPMQLYGVARVRCIEARPAWLKLQAASKPRKPPAVIPSDDDRTPR